MIGQSVPGLLTLNEGAYHIARAGELLKSTVHKLLTTGVTVGLPNSAEISARQMPRSARTQRQKFAKKRGLTTSLQRQTAGRGGRRIERELVRGFILPINCQSRSPRANLIHKSEANAK
jgi:hypothetical protein